MEQLSIANQRIESAKEEAEKDYKCLIAELNRKEQSVKKRLGELNQKKSDRYQVNPDAAQDDLIEVNAGGTIISAKRCTLTQCKGTRFEALFSGRWDKKLQQDSSGRIFLDVNPASFRAIVDYFHEMAISSEDKPPSLPCVDGDNNDLLAYHLELFGLLIDGMPDSCIVKTWREMRCLHDWLEEDGSDGCFKLLYRSSRDGLSDTLFYTKCENQGSTLTLIETSEGFVLGGYSNTPWTGCGHFASANKAFVFALSGNDILEPCKMRLKNANDAFAVHDYLDHGPAFGSYPCDIRVGGSFVEVNFGHHYEPGPTGHLASKVKLEIKDMEVFQVTRGSSRKMIALERPKPNDCMVPKAKAVDRFYTKVNDAINAKQRALEEAELELLSLEHQFKDECVFISNFATGETKDVVLLNVSGIDMATKRSTLLSKEDSVLAQQFNSTKWVQQGYNDEAVQKWTPDDVASWVHNIEDIPSDVGSCFKENEIQGSELLAMNMEGLKMIGIERAGTLCLLSKEIESLRRASYVLIEHSPYCFGKILDCLRSKHLHSLGLANEPVLPQVCDSQKRRFEKVVEYYFPGDCAEFILG
ncbi:hypothetical protein ACHAWF_013653 [Thalassiosira exigua]